MEGPGGRYIEQFCMAVVHRIVLSGGIQDQHGIEFQSLGVLHGKHHDAASEDRLFQVAFHYLNIFSQGFRRQVCAASVPADYRDGVKSFLLPLPADYRGFHKELLLQALFHSHGIAMAYNGFHRITGKTSMVKDPGGKIRYLHRIPVAFLQDAEAVHLVGKQEAAQLFPVIQAEAEVNILGHIPHDGIGAGLDAETEYGIRHHPKILGLVDDDVVGLADHFGLLDPFIDVSQGRQIIDIEFMAGNVHRLSPVGLPDQEIPVKLINGSLPDLAPVSAPVGFQDGLPFRLGVLDPLAQKFFLDFDDQAVVEHIDLALHGDFWVLADIALHGLPVHQADQVVGVHRFPYCGIVDTVSAVPQSFHELLRVQVNGLPQDGVPLQ